MVGYEPGDGSSCEQAWEKLGNCSGSHMPAQSPNFSVLQDMGGCPGDYQSSKNYEEGDKILKGGMIYQCKGWPSSEHCSQAGYEPNEKNQLHQVLGRLPGT